MNKENILSEGFFDTIKKFFKSNPELKVLKKDKKFNDALSDLNNGQQKLEDIMNAEIEKYGLKRKPIKLQKCISVLAKQMQ